MTTNAERYRYWRGFDLTALQALSYVRAEERHRALLARFDSWQWPDHGAYGAFAWADLAAAPDGYTLRVLIGDDDQPYDWGDLEPTEEERENVRAYYVAVQVLDSDESELYHEGIGGVDAIDLPGYLQRDWEDAAAYALEECLLDGAEEYMANEIAERAHWAARDVATV